MTKRLLFLGLGIILSLQAIGQHTVAREWNELLLESIRNDLARPTVHARNLFHTSVAMYDAWAVYDENAKPYFLGNTVDGFYCDFQGIGTPADIEAARNEAISYAMFRLLKHRFFNSPARNIMFPQYDLYFFQLGYDSGFVSTDYTTGSAAALGNYIADQLIDFGLQDGANEQFSYNNQYYFPVNPPLVMEFSGNPDVLDPNRWQPLTLNVFIDQSGNVIPFNTPPFLSPEWGNVSSFALSSDDLTIYQRNNDNYYVYHDPGTPPYLDPVNNTGLSEEYKWGFSMVAVWSSMLDPTDGVMWDISPAGIGNIQYFPKTFEEHRDFYDRYGGGDPSLGRTVNPTTGMPYAPQMVPRADYARVLAEFWADGPDSETPPGHWFTLLHYVNDHPDLEKRFEGQGPILSDLEWDVKSYFMLGGAMHDAAISTWGIKGWYDYIRPVSAIRCMAEYGQSSDPNLPNYHVAGFELEPGYIELVEVGDPLAGPSNQNVGKVKLYAWRGPDYINNPATDEAGVGWILAEDWWPYQRPSFVTPNFAGYTSGHSCFSRTAAHILTMFTGDEYFPGGMGEFEAPQDEFLVFEDGPSVDITLQWATYQDAADQCSLSRIWGGIHPPADDLPGRYIGDEIATDAFTLAKSYFFRDDDQDGFYAHEDCDDTDATVNTNQVEICDGKDNNCDGLVDNDIPYYTFYLDSDGDSFGDANTVISICVSTPPPGYVADASDCDDDDMTLNPSIAEICDGIDNDCNGMIDDNITYYTYYLDADNDSFGDASTTVVVCDATPPFGFVTDATDCNDNDPFRNTDAVEICDNIDNNCDGLVDNGIPFYTYYLDADGDSFGDSLFTISSCLADPPNGYTRDNTDCDDSNPAINPVVGDVSDNGIDEDCNGIDFYKETKIFPNPTSGNITIHYVHDGTLRMDVITLDGRILREYQLNFVNNAVALNISDWSQGVYLLRFVNTDDSLLFYDKLIKD